LVFCGEGTGGKDLREARNRKETRGSEPSLKGPLQGEDLHSENFFPKRRGTSEEERGLNRSAKRKDKHIKKSGLVFKKRRKLERI